VYLTGSVIFLSLVLDRFYAVILDLVKNEERAEVLRTQATKTSKEYLQLLDTHEVIKKEIETGFLNIYNLGKKAVNELEIVKKQAKQTHDEYMRLTDRFVALEKKLEGKSDNKKSD
jgi:B-cell receptor-associated protein 31